MQFEAMGFVLINKGKGKWSVSFGGITENVKYTHENFINPDSSIAYCLIQREDGQKAYVFYSLLEDNKELLTTTGAATKQMEVGKTFLNSLHPKEDLQTHFLSHLSCLKEKRVFIDKKSLEKKLKNLPDKVYEVGKSAMMQSMSL